MIGFFVKNLFEILVLLVETQPAENIPQQQKRVKLQRGILKVRICGAHLGMIDCKGVVLVNAIDPS